jgi:hypothetical protein
MHGLDAEIATLAALQHGIFTLADLSRLGVTRAARRHRLESGRWTTLFDAVYTLTGHPVSWRGQLLATCHAGGPAALASHRAAAALWGFPAAHDAPIEVTCPRWRRHHTADLVIHKTTALDEDGQVVDRIPVTSPARTLLDLGAVCSSTEVEMGLDFALRTRLVTLPDLQTMLETSADAAATALGCSARSSTNGARNGRPRVRRKPASSAFSDATASRGTCRSSKYATAVDSSPGSTSDFGSGTLPWSTRATDTTPAGRPSTATVPGPTHSCRPDGWSSR